MAQMCWCSHGAGFQMHLYRRRWQKCHGNFFFFFFLCIYSSVDVLHRVTWTTSLTRFWSKYSSGLHWPKKKVLLHTSSTWFLPRTSARLSTAHSNCSVLSSLPDSQWPSWVSSSRLLINMPHAVFTLRLCSAGCLYRRLVTFFASVVKDIIRTVYIVAVYWGFCPDPARGVEWQFEHVKCLEWHMRPQTGSRRQTLRLLLLVAFVKKSDISEVEWFWLQWCKSVSD